MIFTDNRKVTNVNISDFFLHVFGHLIDPKSGMFMYNEDETLAWFPPKVTLFDEPPPYCLVESTGSSPQTSGLMLLLKCAHSRKKKQGFTFCLASCADWLSSTKTWSTCLSPWFCSRSSCESNPPWMTWGSLILFGQSTFWKQTAE